jgi:hypothetical protein
MLMTLHDTCDARPPLAYPLEVATAASDARFTLGLALEVADVLTRHGYPPLVRGEDLLRLQHYLFKMIYSKENRL